MGGVPTFAYFNAFDPPSDLTRLKKNKAGYTATEVACGLAGAVMRKAYPSIWAGAVTQKPPVMPKKLTLMDRWTYRSTDIAGYRVA